MQGQQQPLELISSTTKYEHIPKQPPPDSGKSQNYADLDLSKAATAGAPPPPPPSKSEKKPVDYVEVRPQHVKPPAIQVQPPLQRSAAAVKREYKYKTITAKYNCIHGVQRSLFVVGPHH